MNHEYAQIKKKRLEKEHMDTLADLYCLVNLVLKIDPRGIEDLVVG
jgi:hypothetical protein